MTMLFALAAIAVVLALSVHHYHWRRGATGQHVLAILPAALLFIILPIPVLLFSTVRGFRSIAQQGRDSSSTATAVCLDLNRALWLGTLGVLASMIVAALLQWHADRARPGDVTQSRRTWRDWVLIACAMLVLPTVLLGYVADVVPRTIIGVMEAMTGGAARLSTSELGAMSSRISTLLVTGILAGLFLAVAGVAASVGAVFTARGIRQPRRPARAGWVLLAIVLVVAAWIAMQLPVERRWMERVAASTAYRPG